MALEHIGYIGGFSECSEIKDDFNRLVCEIEQLCKAGNLVVDRVSVGAKIPYKAHHWTVLKLVFLKMYVRDVYTPIIGRRYPFMVFIDLFAGSGLNAYDGAPAYIPGSTLIAWFFATYPFDKVYAVGYDSKEYACLKRRLERFIPSRNLWIRKGDANTIVDKVIEDLLNIKEKNGGIHYLAFLDPNSTELHWKTLTKLINLEKQGIYGDFIILLQARQIARVVGKVRKNKANPELLDLFFGTSEWKTLLGVPKGKIEEGIKDIYLRNLQKIKRKAVTELINIKLKRSIHYYLVYATRITSRGSPYLKTVSWLKQFVERVDKKGKGIVDRAIKKALGIPLSDLTQYVCCD